MSASDLPIPLLVFCAIVILYLINCIKILREYERAVIFRLGRAAPRAKGPGIILSSARFDRWSVSRCARKCWKSRRRTSSPATTSPSR